MGFVVALIFVVCTVNYVREPNLIPTPAGLRPETTRTVPSVLPSTPELVEDRKITEQDCSKPIDPSAGNLRCK